jgi:predicted nuclease of predicted toxin-antitoxin system
VQVWIDAQLPPSLAHSLQLIFSVEARHVVELGLVGAKDEEIYRAAAKAGSIVVTKDSDFVRILERLGPPPQVLWITMGNVGNTELWRVLEAQWPRVRELFESGEPLVEIGRPA